MNRGRIFFCKWPISHFGAHFRHFLGIGSITYHSERKNAPNRISTKINYFLQKYRKNFWKLENNAYLCSGLRK